MREGCWLWLGDADCHESTKSRTPLWFLVEAAANTRRGGRVDGLCRLALAVELKNEDRGDTNVILMTENSSLR